MSCPLRLLQVEDTSSDADLIVRILSKAGYQVRAKRVETGSEMRSALAEQAWDVVVCDYRLPQFDGAEALRVVQEAGLDLPFLIVSGAIGEEVAVAMMKSGAHDYLMKDHLARLPAAVERELREARLRQERRQAMLETEQARRLLDAVFTAQTDPVLVWSSTGEVVRTNPAAASWFGFDAAGLHISAFREKLQLPGGHKKSPTWRALHGETIVATEQIVGNRVVEVSSAPMRDAGGQIAGAVTIFHDISARKLALGAAYSELAAIYANAPVILLVVDQERRVEKVNDRAGHLYKRLPDMLTQLPEVTEALENGTSHENIEAWIQQQCLLVSVAPLHDTSHARKVLICAQDITSMKKGQLAMESALAEKTVLLKEVHHRVKNNLAVISSLLNMKATATANPETQAALEESQRRVYSMALIHEHLYESDHLDRINFSDYARRLVQELCSAYVQEPGRISIDLDLDPVQIGIERAVPCALILNELLTNAFKYAFPGERTGTIRVSLHEPEAGTLELAVEDDGVGLPAGRNTTSLGLRIVEILTKQLGGELRQTPGSGTRLALRFPAQRN